MYSSVVSENHLVITNLCFLSILFLSTYLRSLVFTNQFIYHLSTYSTDFRNCIFIYDFIFMLKSVLKLLLSDYCPFHQNGFSSKLHMTSHEIGTKINTSFSFFLTWIDIYCSWPLHFSPILSLYHLAGWYLFSSYLASLS